MTASRRFPSRLQPLTVSRNTATITHFDAFSSLTTFAHRDKSGACSGCFARHAEVEEDSATGRVDIITRGGIRLKRGVPPDGAVIVSLEDWQPESVSGFLLTRVRLVLYAPAGETWATQDDTIVDLRYKALLKWLQDIKSVGPDVYTGDLDDVTSTSDLTLINNTHRFNFNQQTDGGSSPVTFYIIQASYGPTSTDLVFNAVFNTIGGFTSASPDPVLMAEYLSATSITLSTELESDIPPMGDPDEPVPIHAERVKFADADLYEVEGKPTWRSTAGMTTIGGAYGRVLSNGALTVKDAGLSTEYAEIPWSDHAKTYNLRAIHCDNDDDDFDVIRLPNPRDAVPQQGETIDLAIQNDLASGATSTFRTQTAP